MNEILTRLCPRIDFDSYEDFYSNYKCTVPDNFNFAYDVVDEWAKINPEKTALLWTNDEDDIISFTFDDVRRHSNRAANVFKALGIGKGDVVMLTLKQRPEVWFLMCALEKIGAICIPGTYQLTQKDLVYRCNIADVKMLVTVDDADLVANIEKAIPECPSLKHIAVVTGNREANKIPASFIDMKKEMENTDENFIRPTGENDTKITEPMLVYFSSGTTGMPKMVLHNHSLPLGHIVTAKYWQCVQDGKVHLTQTDSGWAKFAWGKIYGQWICGAIVGVYDTEKFSTEGMLKALQKLRPASFCAPATVFRYLIKEDLSVHDFSFIEHCSVAGEPLSPEVFNKIKEYTGLEIREGFGQSETSVMAAAFKWLKVKPGSMGKPAPLFDLDLLDENEQSCDDGIVGNISIKRAGFHIYEEESQKKSGENSLASLPGLFTGYWKDEEGTKKSWYEGVYHTGDMAWHDSDGYYWFIGRNDDVIKCSGYRIGPFEVESALMEHPSVLECAVTAAPDPVRGQVVKATIVLAKDYEPGEALKKELQNHVKRVTAPYKYPRILEFADELPKTISGKIQRNIIRKQSE